MKNIQKALRNIAATMVSISLLMLLVLTTSCGGGGGDDPAPTPTQSITINTGTASTYTVDATATSTPSNIKFTATSSWTATLETVTGTEASQWVTITPTSGKAGTVEMKVTLKPNTETTARGARIKIQGSNNTAVITITQKAATPTPAEDSIELSSGVQTTYTVGATATSLGSTVSFIARSNWTASLQNVSGAAANTWITLSPTSGSAGTITLNITLSENTTTEARSGRVLIAGNNNTVQLTINQEAGAAPGPDPSSGQTFSVTVNGVTFKMVGVSAGTFTMGATSDQGSEAAPDEKPTHSVTLSAFSIGETEVTQALWVAVMGTNPSLYTSYGDQLPVENISYNDCITFINKLNTATGKQFRLPTEAEWEFAARGGASASTQYKYAGSNTASGVAWYYDTTNNNNYRPHPVKTKAANGLGLYDMSGNVWEWCSDFYGAYTSAAKTDPTGAESGSYRVLRGGAWSDNADGCRVAKRHYQTPYSRGLDLGVYGLRLAL